MGLVRTKLEIYKEITYGQSDSTESHVPPTGDFSIVLIEGEAAFTVDCVVRVMFDGAVVWLTKGSSKRTEHIHLVGDGVKKLEIVLDAIDLSSGAVYLGCLVKIQQEV